MPKARISTRTVSLPDVGPQRADPSDLTLKEAGALWLKRAKLDELEVSTLRQYEQHLRLHIEPLIGDKAVRQLRPPVLENFKDRLLQTRSRALSRKVLISLKGILNETVRLGYAEQNPALLVRVRNARRWGGDPFSTPIPSNTTPSKIELRLLIQNSEKMLPLRTPKRSAGAHRSAGTWWHSFIMLAIFSGMRSSELRGLVWDNVDLDRKVVRVRQRADFHNELGPPKSPAANRDIPMSPSVRNTLANWSAQCPETELNLVFPSRNNRIHTNSNIHKMCWGPLQLAAGLTRVCRSAEGKHTVRPRFNFHALRHAAATLFIDQGWPPKKVQSLMGHSSIQVTFDIYGRLWSDPAEDLAAMADLEDDLLQADKKDAHTIVSG